MKDRSQHKFVIQPYRRKYLKDYCKRMSQDNDNVLYDDNVASVLKEQGYSITESPRSVYRVEKLYEALYKYEPGKASPVDFTSHSVKAGLSFAYACFGKPDQLGKLDLLPFTVGMISDITTNKSGSAGLTAWGQTKAESLLRAHSRGVEIIKGAKKPEPCIAFTRTQFNEKTRLVWGYPYSVTAIEGMFARPLINQFKHFKTPMAFGITTLELGTRLRVSSYTNQYAYSTDYSGYDATVSRDVIYAAFRILETWLDLDQIEPETGVSYADIWGLVKRYFVRTPIVMPDSNIYYGKEHGIPSGSYFTQLIGSIVNAIILGAVSHEFSLYVNKADALLLGDDVLYWSNRKVSQLHIAKYIQRAFGIKTNGDKSGFFRFNQPVHFLGRDWVNGIPTLAENEILKRMAFVESFRKYDKNKDKRDREVRMLLLSYAAVYHKAFSIYIKALSPINRYHVPNMSIEQFVYSVGFKSGKREMVNPTSLSGLQRFQRQYVWTTGGDTPSLALQFLK